MRPRNGPPEAVSTSRSTVPGGSAPISWKSAECSESTGMILAPVASASAVTSSPPITRLSLLARARSMPSVSATIVGPSPAAPTTAFSTRSGFELADQLADALLARRAPVRPRPAVALLGRVRVGEGHGRHAVLARLRQQRLPARVGREAGHLEAVAGADHLERLGPDRPGRAEYQHPLHGRPV